MKRHRHIPAVASAAALALAMTVALNTPASAADYTAFSTEELAAMRGTMWGQTTEEREAFRAEWHTRASTMNQEQRRKYTESGTMGRRDGSGPQNSMGMGRGAGGGMHRGRDR